MQKLLTPWETSSCKGKQTHLTVLGKKKKKKKGTRSECCIPHETSPTIYWMIVYELQCNIDNHPMGVALSAPVHCVLTSFASALLLASSSFSRPSTRSACMYCSYWANLCTYKIQKIDVTTWDMWHVWVCGNVPMSKKTPSNRREIFFLSCPYKHTSISIIFQLPFGFGCVLAGVLNRIRIPFLGTCTRDTVNEHLGWSSYYLHLKSSLNTYVERQKWFCERFSPWLQRDACRGGVITGESLLHYLQYSGGRKLVT